MLEKLQILVLHHPLLAELGRGEFHLPLWRGAPMMALDRGGSCEGVAYRLPAEETDDALAALIRREMPFAVSGMKARWMAVRSGQEPLHAVGFVINRAACDYVPGLSEDQVVTALATAAGSAGSMAEYLLNTITQLQAHGIHDRILWHLQDRVAARLETALPACPAAHITAGPSVAPQGLPRGYKPRARARSG